MLMKHRLLSAIVATAWVAGAFAQSVVIVDKEDLPHVIPANRIENISFIKTGGDQPGKINFTSIVAKPYSGGKVDITLTAEDDTSIQMYVCGPSDAAYLMDGEYKVSPDNSPFTVDSDPGWTYVKRGDTQTGVQDGTMTVSRTEAEYTISLDFTLVDGSKFTGEFIGEIPNYSFYMKLPNATVAKVTEINDQVPGEYYIKFNDASYSYEMAIDFFAAADTQTLPAGFYFYGDDKSDHTFGPGSYIDIYSPNNNYRFGEDSDIVVTFDGTDYNISINCALPDGRIIEVVYQGPIEFPTPKPAAVEFANLKCDYVGAAYSTVIFATADGKTSLKMDLSYPSGSISLPVGKYTYGGEGLCIDAGYATLTVDGVDTEVSSGTLDIAKSGDAYEVTFDLGLAGGKSFAATYKGGLGTFADVVDIEYTTANFQELDDMAAGEFYVKMNNQNWTSTIGIDFYAEPGSTALPNGTYTYSADKTPGTFGPISYVDTSSPYYSASSARMAEGSTVTVSADGVTGTLKMADGRTINIKFSGEIK